MPARPRWIIGLATSVTSTRFDAAVFDFDGTLVDSAAAKRQAFFDIFPADAGCAAVVGGVLNADPDGSRHAVIPRMLEKMRARGLPPAGADAGTLIGRYGEASARAVAAAPELPGAGRLLARLARVMPLHLCSNTPHATLRRHVEARGWSAFFASVEGYPSAKPARVAALIAEAGLSPSRVAVVGDGVSDAEAAAANGCAFFAIRAPQDLARAGKALEEGHV